MSAEPILAMTRLADLRVLHPNSRTHGTFDTQKRIGARDFRSILICQCFGGSERVDSASVEGARAGAE